MDGTLPRILLAVAFAGLGVLYLVRAPVMAARPRARLSVRGLRRLGVLWLGLAALQAGLLLAAG